METEHPTPPPQSPFARLPLELRLQIYTLAFTSYPQATTIGTSATKLSHTAWPHEPNLTRTTPWIRDDALPVFYATRDLTFNLQSRLGMDMVLAWIARCAEVNPVILSKVREITIVAGSGFYERPQEIRVDLVGRRVVGARVQLPARSEGAGQGPAFVLLRERLGVMPRRGEVGFDAVEVLREVVGCFECMIAERTP